MPIYKGKTDKEPLSNNFPDDDTTTDEEFANNAKVSPDAARVRVAGVRPSSSRRKTGIFAYFAILLALFVIVVCILGSFYIHSRHKGKPKPYIQKCLMHYHEWKTGISGGSTKSYTLQGEFYQQVEIDASDGVYEQLNVPSLLNAKHAKIVHEFKQQLTAIIDHDHGRCFILPLNRTLVIPLHDFYNLVKNIQAGYDAPNAQVVREHYRLLMPQIDDVSHFGPRVYSQCRFYETYHLHRADAPLALSKRHACRFARDQYCLGCAGSEFMSIITIDECVG